MYKLIILIPGVEKLPDFGDHWPGFLHLVEQIPGLRREATSHVHNVVDGSLDCSMIHELFFDDQQALMDGLSSPVGRQAAGILHRITHNRAVLMLADHREDDMENILRAKAADNNERTD